MSGKKFIDLVQLFASNIQKDANGDPCIFFNDKLAPVMAAKATYIEPLQNAGIKVILNVLGDHKGIGISNLTDDQIEKFAAILTYIVKEYGLDGIGFDDEYADYSTPIDPTSASKLVLKLREKFNAEFPGERKIIQMFQWNYVSNISAAAGAEIDLADHGAFGHNVFQASSAFAGVTNDRWCPQAIQMGQSYNAIFLNQIKTRSSQAASGNYGGIMMFNVRKASNVNPLPVFQKIAEGAFGATVTYTGTEYSQDWTFNPAGYTITYADIQ
jgi:glycosyl hydrolases family 18